MAFITSMIAAVKVDRMNEYRLHKPGDVLRLDDDLPYANSGLYVLLSVGDVCVLRMFGFAKLHCLYSSERHRRPDHRRSGVMENRKPNFSLCAGISVLHNEVTCWLLQITLA
jgi:hypothetical protein